MYVHELYVSAYTCVHVDRRQSFGYRVWDRDLEIREDSSFIDRVVNTDSVNQN